MGWWWCFLQPASMQAPKMLSPSFSEWAPTCHDLTRFLTKLLSQVLEMFLSQAGRNILQILKSHQGFPQSSALGAGESRQH